MLLLCFSSRTTSNSPRLVPNKNPPLHWPSELEVPGGSTHRQGYERLFKTQVWQRVRGKRGEWVQTLCCGSHRLCNNSAPCLQERSTGPLGSWFTSLFIQTQSFSFSAFFGFQTAAPGQKVDPDPVSRLCDEVRPQFTAERIIQTASKPYFNTSHLSLFRWFNSKFHMIGL